MRIAKAIKQQETFCLTRCKLIGPKEAVAELLFKAYRRRVLMTSSEFIHTSLLDEYIMKVAGWLCGENPRLGVAFSGKTLGNGKTTMLKAVSDTVAYILRNMTKVPSSDLSVFYIKAVDVCQLAQNGETDKIESVKKMRFLHIDDIGAEPAIVCRYGNKLRPIADILDFRYDRSLYTACSTNMETEGQIIGMYGERTMSRYSEFFATLHFEEYSFRTERNRILEEREILAGSEVVFRISRNCPDSLGSQK